MGRRVVDCEADRHEAIREGRAECSAGVRVSCGVLRGAETGALFCCVHTAQQAVSCGLTYCASLFTRLACTPTERRERESGETENGTGSNSQRDVQGAPLLTLGVAHLPHTTALVSAPLHALRVPCGTRRLDTVTCLQHACPSRFCLACTPTQIGESFARKLPC